MGVGVGVGVGVGSTALTSAAALVPIVWSLLKDYQKQRILTFLNPDQDPLGTGYHIIQSKIAIGSGMISGKGYLQGTQNALSFLPEEHTDFIFSVLAEEWGAVGSVAVLMLFLLVLIIKIMMKYRIKAEETTVGFIGIDLGSVRLARVLDKIGFRRILGFDHGEVGAELMQAWHLPPSLVEAIRFHHAPRSIQCE